VSVEPAIHLALGTNLGDRRANLRRALNALAQRLCFVGASSVYETEPVGYRDQPWFYNAVVACRGSLTPGELLRWLLDIEASMGRRRGPKDGPRLIDLDLIYFGNQVIDEPDLVVPHPRMHQRAFVLRPLAELAPEVKHPVLGLTAARMLEGLENPETVRRLPELGPGALRAFWEDAKAAPRGEGGQAP